MRLIIEVDQKDQGTNSVACIDYESEVKRLQKMVDGYREQIEDMTDEILELRSGEHGHAINDEEHWIGDEYLDEEEETSQQIHINSHNNLAKRMTYIENRFEAMVGQIEKFHLLFNHLLGAIGKKKIRRYCEKRLGISKNTAYKKEA